ncbi:hypothetical protein BVRB_2g044800 isoform A [Beta vulgaris subsp. vulgaris]|uniref:Uncharacterized protein n=1 Tax=Beta vulgaris subsp. vulgaris TaxID=3555 RepID=A0A0J8E895_BETVV|nr:hypothetical protein BVRB_2g044800 isoform A [Beta vulgaris subsp. vulgaris]
MWVAMRSKLMRKAVSKILTIHKLPVVHLFQLQQLDEAVRIPKETIDILRDQVFGFDTFFVTGQEAYEIQRNNYVCII